MSRRLVETLSWVSQLLRLPSLDRKRLRAEVLDGVSEFSERGEGKPGKAGATLRRMLSRMKFIGFVPNITYVKEAGDANALRALWVHPFGTETLLYKHPDLPVLILVNPNIRLNESFLSEMKLNRKQQLGLLGISG